MSFKLLLVMVLVAAACLAIFLYACCAPVQTQEHPSPMNITNQYAVEVHREDAPKFKRTYSRRIHERATIYVSARNWMPGWRPVDYSGELRQPNGKWVLFDPESIADKILDRELVPLVEAAVKEIIALDKAFRASKPSEFVDENGTKWTKAP